jgi:hypothetical protein
VGGGAFGLHWALSARRKLTRPALGGLLPTASGGSTPPARVAGGPARLKPRHGPLGRILGTLFVALFWNAVTSVFVWQVVEGWRSGSGDLFLTLFMTPFLLIGLALLVAVPHQILAATNPRPRLELDEHAAPGRDRAAGLELPGPRGAAGELPHPTRRA